MSFFYLFHKLVLEFFGGNNMKKDDMKVKIIWGNKKINYNRLYEILADVILQKIEEEEKNENSCFNEG